MKFVMYLRKSRADMQAEAKGEGETLARHERILLDVAKRNKIVISDIYREVVSGETIASRPVMQRLLSEVEQGMWDGVLVVEVERLARGDTIDQGIVSQAFKLSNTKIITPTKTYDPNNEFDEEYFEFGLFMSRREFKTINRRLQQGRVSSIREGKYLGSVPPYGYLRQKLEKEKGYTLIPHPEQAPVVKMIFELYVYGEAGERFGPTKIARKLNSLKIPGYKIEWTRPTIRQIIINPVYIGKICWLRRPRRKKSLDGVLIKSRPNGRPEEIMIFDGMHEAIISEDLFDAAQEIIKTNPIAVAPHQSPMKNPLCGIVYCGLCGRRMLRKPNKNDTLPASLICPFINCKNIGNRLDEVEETLFSIIEKWYSQLIVEPDKQKLIPVDIGIIEKNMQRLDADLDDFKKQLSKAHDFLELGVYDTDTFLSRTNILKEKIESSNNQKKELQNEIEKIYNYEKEKKSVKPKLDKLIKIYNATQNPAEKNELIRTVIDKIIYFKDRKNTGKRNVNYFTLQIIPRVLV